jgi:hypothetical protein
MSSMSSYYDKDAPTKVGARHMPSLVLILCAVFVRGLTQAASLVSRVVKPYRCRIDQKNRRDLGCIYKSKPGWIVSKIFFFGLSCDMGTLSKVNHEPSLWRKIKLVYVPSYSDPSKYTLSPGLEFGGGCIISIPPSFPSLEVA